MSCLLSPEIELGDLTEAANCCLYSLTRIINNYHTGNSIFSRMEVYSINYGGAVASVSIAAMIA